MKPLGIAVIALALLQGVWLTFDGSRALVMGDYFTPSTGPRAGQLGPWSKVVSAIGFEPRSTLVKCVYLCLGIAWIAAAFVFLARPAIGWWFVLVCAICSLWYLPVGTLFSLILIGILLTPAIRNRV